MQVSETFLWAADPVEFARGALGFECDEWQKRVLRSTKDTLLVIHRQAGKTTVTSIAALHTAKFQPGSLTLLLAPSLRQSREQFAKIRQFLRQLEPAEILESDNSLPCGLSNGCRIVALPGADPNRLEDFLVQRWLSRMKALGC
jgi:hypothetical protein